MGASRDPAAKPTAGLIARSLVFAVLTLWMFGGPFYVQVLDQHNKYTRYLRVWSMFSARGIGFVEARFFQLMPDGTRRDLDRFELLGYHRPRKAPGWLWRLADRGKVRNTVTLLCVKLGPGADVRVISRRATTRGWRPELNGSEEWCAAISRRAPDTRDK